MAICARASVVSPSVGVLPKPDGLQRRVGLTKAVGGICATALDVDFWVAPTPTFWAAIRNAVNLGGIIKLRIILAVEVRITNNPLRRLTLLPARNLVVNVKVLCAAFLLNPLLAPTVVCVDMRAIEVTLVPPLQVSKVVLIMMLACLMAHGLDGAGIIALNFTPMSIVVNVRADCGAMLVILLPGSTDAILGATFVQQFLLTVIVQEDIQVAFNFLRGRPVNLAVLLLALKVGNHLLIDVTALFVA
jgi:hypothetical protein